MWYIKSIFAGAVGTVYITTTCKTQERLYKDLLSLERNRNSYKAISVV